MTTAYILRFWSSFLHSLKRGDESNPKSPRKKKKAAIKSCCPDVPLSLPTGAAAPGGSHRRAPAPGTVGCWPVGAGVRCWRVPRPREHEPRDVTRAERPVAVAFSPSKNNSHEHHQRHASNWNQLSKLPAGSRFRSVCEPFWERAIKNSEQLKAEPLPQVLHVPRVAMESLVCQSRRFLLLVVGRLATRAGGVLWAGAAPRCLLHAHSTVPIPGDEMGGGGSFHATAPPARAHSGGLFQHFPQLAASTFGLELAGGVQRAGATSRLEHSRARLSCSGGI